MSQRHLSSGDALPTLSKDILYIYNNRYCPYALKVQLVLHHKSIPYENININLRDKPTWYSEKNPSKTTPAMEINDTVLSESGPMMEYIDDVFPGPKLTPTDPYTKAKGRILVEEFSKVRGLIRKVMVLSSDEERPAAVKSFYTQMEKFENCMPATKFLCGEEVSMADYECWPFANTLNEMRPRFGIEPLPTGRCHKFRAWMTAMEETPGVKATKISLDEMLAFRERLQLLGDKIDFDFATNK